MNADNVSLAATTSHSSLVEGIIVRSSSLATIDFSSDDTVNMIELDDVCENCTPELTPYPYTPTSEEMTDYYQLEQSLGEDWSFRLACELSSGEVTMDDSDEYESIGDSVTCFTDCQRHEPDETVNSSLLPEDIEIRTQARRDNYPFSKHECF